MVLYCCKNGVETKHVLSYYLGPETRHTVYEAEVAGEIMAQELLYTQTCRFGCHVSMYVDNQVSILSTHTISPNPRHYLLDILHAMLTHCKKKIHNLSITIQWIPSHLDIEGNEEADRQANRAEKGNTDSPLNRLPLEFCKGLTNSKATILQMIPHDSQQYSTQECQPPHPAKYWPRALQPTPF